ncbi:hypothetical protein N6B72_13775 [Chryseobacterium soli]|uniref:hypothetical protein n=1 Tax=Chryseobacterium soli TaxID=445961 RepID=UPI002954A731|nr:hypothetical protein [Chryseobacterium soli]MDV7697990.1 hypothetical protein [Chryseobacterium soli]
MKKMFELPFLMLVHHQSIDLEAIPNPPDLENDMAEKYMKKYLVLYKELAVAVYNNDEESIKSLRSHVSKISSEGVKIQMKLDGKDTSKIAGWLIELYNY